MKRLLTRTSSVLATLIALSAASADFKFPSQTFSVPDGFEVELVAGPPLIERPISASFDEAGQLYVTDSSGSNDKVEKQLAEKPHRIRRLQDADGDGRFEKSSLFAAHLMFPEGCLWFDGSLYVSAPPSIWKLTPPHPEDAAELREEWHLGQTLTGCANDLHGPYLGLDGWIYWCKGAFATQSYQWPGKKPFVTRAAHIFRARPDHSEMEPVMTGGMDNPVGVAFTANGERILCGTFLMHPEAGKRDGLLHAVYGGVYGKVNDVTDDHKQTGDLMPIMTHLGAAAPCSVLRYESGVFGPEYRDSLFVCCFNLHKVTRQVLEPEGASFKTKDTDFLVSDSTDFHPTDVLEDADGSLLVVDTGGWYKLCCPTSQLSKPDVLGAIYRIRRVGGPRVTDPRGLTIAWDQLSIEAQVNLLGDERPAVRKRALLRLGKAGVAAVPPLAHLLRNGASSAERLQAVWGLTRIDAQEARQAVRTAIIDRDQNVVHAAVASISLWRDAQAIEPVLKILRTAPPQLQRVAAEALGRIGNPKAVSELLAVSAGEHDRVLEHSLTYALIEIADAAGTAKGLQSRDPHEQRAALIALDQMDEGGLKPAMVTPLLTSPVPLLRQTALWIAGHHADWAESLAGYFRERLSSISAGENEELKRQLVRFAGAPSIQELTGDLTKQSSTPTATRELLLQTMAMASLNDAPAPWAEAVASCLKEKNEPLLFAAVPAAKTLSGMKKEAPDFSEALLRIGLRNECATGLRLEALAALPHGLASIGPDLFRFLCANLDPSQPVLMRSAAATVLSNAKLDEPQLLALADLAGKAGPLEMMKLLGAFEQASNETVGLRLLNALKSSKSLASLRPDAFKTAIAKYPESVQQQGQELLASLNVDTAQQRARLDQLSAALPGGDVRRGQALFNSPRTACATCHAIGYLGGRVGPDLTSIGQVRTERDLLESIVYPSASFVRSFEPVVVKTKAQEEYSGVVRKDAPEELVLATGPGTEVRVERSDIVEMRPGTVSVMPAGLADQLTHQELADLLAFLKATKWGAN